jgi:ABC-type microcin C transport system permease subunit YejB
MVRRDGAETKKERMEQIAKKIQGALYRESPISLSKMVAQIEYEFGLTKLKIKEYLKTLQDLERFTVDEPNNQIRKSEVQK